MRAAPAQQGDRRTASHFTHDLQNAYGHHLWQTERSQPLPGGCPGGTARPAAFQPCLKISFPYRFGNLSGIKLRLVYSIFTPFRMIDHPGYLNILNIICKHWFTLWNKGFHSTTASKYDLHPCPGSEKQEIIYPRGNPGFLPSTVENLFQTGSEKVGKCIDDRSSRFKIFDIPSVEVSYSRLERIEPAWSDLFQGMMLTMPDIPQTYQHAYRHDWMQPVLKSKLQWPQLEVLKA